MSNRVIPSKLMSFEENVGAETVSQIKCEKVRLTPFGINSSTAFKPNALSRIPFRVPAYSNSFLDTENSFFSFRFTSTAAAGLTSSVNTVPGLGLPIFNRLLIKSSGGLVISDETNYDVLTRMMTITRVDHEENRQYEAIYGDGEIATAPGLVLCQKLRTGYTYVVQFKTSILST